jgi:hypothetical protein
LLVVAIFYSGNLQSHIYLPIFALCVAAGYAGRSPRSWLQGAKLMVSAGILGAMLAAPVLLPQLELFANAARPLGEPLKLYWLETGAVLAAIHPWMAGTFRTISIQSVNGGPSFHLAIGGVLIVLAAFGWARRNQSETARGVLPAAGCLILAFLLIAFTPLHPILYLRAAGLGIIGLIVLAASGLENLLMTSQPEPRWARGIIGASLVIALATSVLSQVIYPRFQPRVEAMLLARAETDGYGGASRDLRRFQAANFTAEVSPRNPECALNLVALALLGCAFFRPRAFLVAAACAVSLVPLLSFAERFITRSPIRMWSRLLEGGPAQKQITAQTSPNERFNDPAPQNYLRLFPQEISSLHRLHVAHGYAALLPENAFRAGSEKAADSGLEQPSLARLGTRARFGWKSNALRNARVIDESFDRLQLSLGAGDDDILYRLDTWYPGWTANGQSLAPLLPARLGSEVPVTAGRTEVSFRYRPTLLPYGLALSFVGLAAMAVAGRRSAGRIGWIS